VRTLATQAARAAGNRATMIEGTVSKIREGYELVQKTGEEFKTVGTGSKRVVELVGEIAAASNEQSRRIKQINATIQKMDKTIQQNAANAEEAASASLELNAQALQADAVLRGETGGPRYGERQLRCCDVLTPGEVPQTFLNAASDQRPP
jgi:methyl-accepting chemotaxis protein